MKIERQEQKEDVKSNKVGIYAIEFGLDSYHFVCNFRRTSGQY